ncbi:hypothetical protein [Streptosporangium carneum]|uniref:hypothetical protein n=1 Tax=Streptosporangium carneum TaxID=47481 RepID=UPI0031EECEAB
MRAELVEVLPQDRHQLRRDGHRSPFVLGPVLEAPVVMSLPAVGPPLVRLWLGLGQDEPPPAGLGKAAVLLAQPEGLGRAQTAEVEAGEEAPQVPATVEAAHVGHRGQQFPSLDRIDHHPPVHDLPDLRRLPRLHLADRVGGQLLQVHGVLQGVVEDRPLPGDRGGSGGPTVEVERQRVQAEPYVTHLGEGVHGQGMALKPHKGRPNRFRALHLPGGGRKRVLSQSLPENERLRLTGRILIDESRG